MHRGGKPTESAHRGRTASSFGLNITLLMGALALPALAVPPAVTGVLDKVNGARVLKLWGNPYERGHAHGFLLCREILGFVESSLLDLRILPNPQDYETKIVQGMLGMLHIPDDRASELEGMLAGVAAAAGTDSIRLERLGRDLSVKDLEAMNTLADWYRLGCSSFSAWGDFEADGEMITARNLDFMSFPGMNELHLVIAYVDPGEGLTPWVSITWPGLIGAYTAMNEKGVTVSMHDAPGLPPTHRGRFTPRSFVLRNIMEHAAAETAVSDARAILGRTPVVCGNNIHVSAPFAGQALPAAIFEYDGDTARDRGVTMRAAGDNSAGALKHALLCTNHYRKRSSATQCYRFGTMETALERLAVRGRKITTDIAREIVKSVSVNGTLHSVVFLPNRGEFLVGFADAQQNGARVAPIHFKIADLLEKP